PPLPRSPLFPYTTLFRSFCRSSSFGRSLASQCANLPWCLAGYNGSPNLVTRSYVTVSAETLSAKNTSGRGFHCCLQSFSLIMSRSEEHTSELQSRFDLVC